MTMVECSMPPPYEKKPYFFTEYSTTHNRHSNWLIGIFFTIIFVTVLFLLSLKYQQTQFHIHFEEKKQFPMKEINEHSTFPLVLDFSDKATLNDFHCFANNSYIAGIARIYKNVPYGEVDENAMENYANARKANFPLLFYAELDPFSWKSAFGPLFLKVTHPNLWHRNAEKNVAFIQKFLDRARKHHVTVGIFTSWYDWLIITNDFTGINDNGYVELWYWHTLGYQFGNKAARDFEDFREFGDWTGIVLKQYGEIQL
ncbi:lysozyme-like protein 7 [Ditylenchus destructor]|uniref:Lysozyme-like protein 7 n=1 Tax=Ditylenchus destructor TaxID=166010 RepID=A0AAD4NF64_9BILA|nr:lysozyme-like protein 7 [Ditylenchus destructor]